MNATPENLLCKVVLLGESGVGKTSIISRYVNKIFHNNFIPTMGSCFATKTEVFNDLGKSIKYEVLYLINLDMGYCRSRKIQIYNKDFL